MKHRKPKRLFFAGTDTEVGKTYVASLVAEYLFKQGYRVGVYKPVASGCQIVNGELVAEDAVSLWNAVGRRGELNQICPQRFTQPLAPPQAALADGKEVNQQQLVSGMKKCEENSDVLIVEGAGGLFSPIADGLLNIELAKQLQTEVILVAENRLGVIHQVISSCRAATALGVTPKGIFLSHPNETAHESLASNPTEISKYCDIPMLGVVPFGGDLNQVSSIEKVLPKA